MPKTISKMGKILGITPRKTKNNTTMYLFEIDEGAGKTSLFSSFNNNEGIKVGELVHVELSQNGNYLNLESIERMHEDMPKVQTADQLSKEDKEAYRQKSIVTQSIFNMAWEIVKYRDRCRTEKETSHDQLLNETLEVMEKIREKLKGQI